MAEPERKPRVRGNPAKIVRPKGQRCEGSGRVKGTPNKVSVELRQLVSELVNDPIYQRRLRGDFRKRKLHPAMESVVWAYHMGKPRQDIHLDANVTVTGRLEEEKRLIAQLDLAELEDLAAQSQGLIDRAKDLVLARNRAALPPHLVVEAEPVEGPAELLRKVGGSDNGTYVNQSEPPEPEPAKPSSDEG